ncbi:MAG: class I SAM-dependent methyltransferase [Methanoregulaceae archaeon]|nr:class I SAM-dependent methyltransferase [Methanoregulaceae archaeon]
MKGFARIPGISQFVQILHYPPGHFYSPIPSLEDIDRTEQMAAQPWPKQLKGIEINLNAQLELLNRISEFYKEMPFPEKKTNGKRYFLANPYYSYADAIFLYGLIRAKRPGRIIEVGSGFSTAAMMDVNEIFFGDSIQISCIEPYPKRLQSLFQRGDLDKITLYETKLQDIGIDLFSSLRKNDILFIDSTHVAKAGSDVNRILFDILPELSDGVLVHFHDVSYPFEYPGRWLREGRSWNENYILRAFLEYNDKFSIAFFTTYLEHFYREVIAEKMPLCLKDPGGSIWLQKAG